MSDAAKVRELQSRAIERTVRSICFGCMSFIVIAGWVLSSIYLMNDKLDVASRAQLAGLSILYALVPAAFMGGVGRFLPWSVFERLLKRLKV